MGPLKWALHITVLLLLVASLGDAGDSDGAPDEYHVKAAYMIGFSRFIEGADNGGVSELILCSAGDDRMTEALRQVIARRASASPHISVRSVIRKDDVSGCTVLYISATKVNLVRESPNSDTDTRTLTVGDSPGFLEAGGAIEFVWAGNKIQFNASLPAIQRSGLKLSSRMLNLARNLRNAPKGAAQ
jgi:hypothetical protein